MLLELHFIGQDFNCFLMNKEQPGRRPSRPASCGLREVGWNTPLLRTELAHGRGPGVPGIPGEGLPLSGLYTAHAFKNELKVISTHLKRARSVQPAPQVTPRVLIHPSGLILFTVAHLRSRSPAILKSKVTRKRGCVSLRRDSGLGTTLASSKSPATGLSR